LGLVLAMHHTSWMIPRSKSSHSVRHIKAYLQVNNDRAASRRAENPRPANLGARCDPVRSSAAELERQRSIVHVDWPHLPVRLTAQDRRARRVPVGALVTVARPLESSSRACTEKASSGCSRRDRERAGALESARDRSMPGARGVPAWLRRKISEHDAMARGLTTARAMFGWRSA
jgi:hypothetical protein